MTEPIPVGPTGDQLAAETAAALEMTALVREQLRVATRQITALFFAYAINGVIPDNLRRSFADQSSQIIAQVQADIRPQLWTVVLRALSAGAANALVFVTNPTQSAQSLVERYQGQFEQAVRQEAGQAPQNTAHWVAWAIAAAQARLAGQLLVAQAAPQLGIPSSTLEEALARLAPAHRALDLLERDVRWLSNAAYNQAARDVADIHGLDRMWIAERDACLHCLAYSGRIAEAGHPYPSDLTFYVGPDGNYKPLKPYPVGSAVWGPPLHPNCRCFQRPAPRLVGYPVMPWETREYHPSEALRREARRSVLRGVSGSDSLPARLRATSALLAAGAGLPSSVEARARAAVRARRYRR